MVLKNVFLKGGCVFGFLIHYFGQV